jgi:hypothetical protein
MSLQIRSRPDYDPAVRLGESYAFMREAAWDRGQHAGNGDAVDADAATIASADDSRSGLTAEAVTLTSLPILATANDARELVRFLKKRPNGVTVVEAMNAEPRRIFDARKIAAYEFWGIIRREKERLTLTELGKELAEALEPECGMYRDVLHRVPAYHVAIRSIFEEGLDIATHLDVLRHWSQLRTVTPFERENAQDMEAAVVCFFSLCHAAELGTSTVGKRGQPARLRVDIEQVASFLAEEPGPVGFEPVRTGSGSDRGFISSASVKAPSLSLRVPTAAIRQVLISTSGPLQSVDHLISLLSLAGFASTTVDSADFENGLLPSSELSEMQQCQAGVFVIGRDDCVEKNGTLSLRHEWITKISVAAALFDWRILLFWNGKLPPPDELTTSGLLVLSSEKLDWDASLEMANRIKALAFSQSE